MILPITNFKARLIKHPEIFDKEMPKPIKLGKFTVGKKYRVYSIYSEKDFTDFLVADDDGVFRWIKTFVFRKIKGGKKWIKKKRCRTFHKKADRLGT
jgi:hypothetical protein